MAAAADIQKFDFVKDWEIMEAAAARRRDEKAGLILFVVLLLFIPLMIFGIVKWVSMNTAIAHSSCNPRKYVQELSAPRLLDHSLNSSIIIGLEFKRGAARSGDVAMYRDLSLRLYYDLGEDPVANRTIPRFRMVDRRSVRYRVVMDASSLPWEDAFNTISGGSAVLLRVVLTGKYKARDYREPDFHRGECDICDCDWLGFEVEAGVWVDVSAHMISNTSIPFYEIYD